MATQDDLVFVDSTAKNFFWILELEDHVHNIRDGRCLKNTFGPRCNPYAKQPSFLSRLVNKALDFVAARL